MYIAKVKIYSVTMQFQRNYQYYYWQSAKLYDHLQWPEKIKGVRERQIKRVSIGNRIMINFSKEAN